MSPYNPNPDPDRGGTDRLWKVVTDNDLKSKNVYAEMGSAWALAMTDPVVAQHYIGKALKYMGPDRVVWGSECVWFGCPQNQIEAMKAFKISTEFQDLYGYPDYTDALRRNVFGLNGAPLYRVDPAACRYKVSVSQLANYRKQLDEDWGPRRHMLHTKPAITTLRGYWQAWKNRMAVGRLRLTHSTTLQRVGRHALVSGEGTAVSRHACRPIHRYRGTTNLVIAAGRGAVALAHERVAQLGAGVDLRRLSVRPRAGMSLAG